VCALFLLFAPALQKVCARHGCTGTSALSMGWKSQSHNEGHKVVENGRAKILWDFQIQTDKLVMANQLDIMLVDKQQKKAVVIDVAIPRQQYQADRT
ncbi:hypothetical protein P7M41_26505, partial [Vibrio parahaemolyticus]|nr:hypothetical protein [Vibrio parahaemolyticus]